MPGTQVIDPHGCANRWHDSCPRSCDSRYRFWLHGHWIPAFAGMTAECDEAVCLFRVTYAASGQATARHGYGPPPVPRHNGTDQIATRTRGAPVGVCCECDGHLPRRPTLSMTRVTAARIRNRSQRDLGRGCPSALLGQHPNTAWENVAADVRYGPTWCNLCLQDLMLVTSGWTA